MARFSTGAAYRQVLVDVLSRDYPLDHGVILYQAATLPTFLLGSFACRWRELPKAEADMHFTLVIPPAQALGPIIAPASACPRSDRELVLAAQGWSGATVQCFQSRPARLRMRPIVAADAPLYEHLYTDEETMRFIGAPLVARACRQKFS